MALDISTFVNIDTEQVSGGVPRTAFGLGLLVTVDDSIAAGGAGKVRLFNNAEAVEDVFGSGGVLDAANVWFSGDPPPKSLYVGRWANADVGTTIRGGAPAAVTAITAANATFTLNGNTVTVNLSTGATYTAKAALIQAAIRTITGFSGATFTYDTDAFLLTLADASEVTGGVFGNTAVTTDTDVAALLGFDAGSNPDYRQGHDAETVTAAVSAMLGFASAGEPKALMIDAGVPGTVGSLDTKNALAAYVQTREMVFALQDSAAQILVAADDTSRPALAFGASQDKVASIYSDDDKLAGIGLLALMSSQNLNERNSIVTPNAKPLPGVLPTEITDAQLPELKRKRTNVYTTVNGLPSLVGGYTSKAGSWLDAVWWLMWMKNELSLGIWNSQRASRRFNQGALLDALIEAMQAGVNSGGLEKGGKVNAAVRADIIQVTGNTSFSGVLSTGYLVWVDPSPTTADRTNRIGRFKAWGVGAPAIHEVLGTLTFQN